MATNNDPMWNMFVNWLFSVRNSVEVRSDFKGQVDQVKSLLRNDKTGLVSTILEFMIHSASVDMRYETGNPTFDNVLKDWQLNINKNFSIDIPRGMKSFTAQYFRERWTSSLIAVKVRWGNFNGFMMPTKIWVLNGAQVKTEEEKNGVLGGLRYKLGNDTVLQNTPNESILIRKPFNSWYEKQVTPYLVKSGALFNGLVKSELLSKQADVIQEIIPYILSIKAGNDAMFNDGVTPSAEDLTKIEDSITNSKEKKLKQAGHGTRIAKMDYSVDLEHLLPDMTKFLNDTIIKPIDRNLLSSLGLVELEGFSGSRQEAILNPKVLVEEVKDGVSDYVLLQEEITQMIVDRNKDNHPKFLSNKISVVPASIKAFITNDMRILARSAYDRGLIDKKSFDEDYLGLDFETVVTRRDIERRRNLEERMFPYVILNQDDGDQPDTTGNPEDVKEQTPEKQKTEKDMEGSFECLNPLCKAILEIPEEATDDNRIRCPECGNIEHLHEIKAKHHYKKDKKKKKSQKATEEYFQAPFDKNSELPSSVKDNMTQELQTIFRRVFNDSFDRYNDEDRAFSDAWPVIRDIAQKNNNGVWVRRRDAKEFTIDDLSKSLKSLYSLSEQIKLVKDIIKK